MTARRRAIAFVNGDRAASDVRHTGPHAPERILRARMKTARFITILKALAAAAILVFAAVPLRGQGMASEPLKTTLEARKVVRGTDGRESFVPADVARPGDVIEYVATYRNTTREALKNLEATLPIPEHTELVAGSTHPASVRASFDAREFAPLPLKRKVVANGRETTETVPYREYRFLRWEPVHLGAEASITVTARVRVLE